MKHKLYISGQSVAISFFYLPRAVERKDCSDWGQWRWPHRYCQGTTQGPGGCGSTGWGMLSVFTLNITPLVARILSGSVWITVWIDACKGADIQHLVHVHLCTKHNRCVLAATLKLYRQLECIIYSLGGLQGKGINIQLCGKAQLRGGTPGPFYHVNDISVYLGCVWGLIL